MDGAIIRLNYTLGAWGPVLYCLIVIAVSAILSFLLGLERELHGRPAGIVTHVLISAACALLGAFSVYGLSNILYVISDHLHPTSNLFEYKIDISRVAAGVVTGVGFLGAGVIIKSKASVKGLSTAATIFMSAAIGLACGAGYVLETIFAMIFVLIVNFLLKKVKKHITKRSPKIRIITKANHPLLGDLSKRADECNLVIKSTDLKEVEYNGEQCLEFEVVFAFSSNIAMILDVMNVLRKDEAIYLVESDRLKKIGIEGSNE